MAFIDISPNIPFVNIFSSSYPSGVSASVVRDALIANNIISKSFDITNVVISTTPFVGFANGEYTGKNITVFVQAYELDSEVITPSPNEDAYSITVYYVNSNPQVDDTTPPVITPKGSTDITITTGQFSSSTTFINTYFTVSDPESGVSSISLNPNIDWASVRARGSVNVVAVNGDGYQSTYSFFLTIVLSPSQTPPEITGPSSITVYTDENMNNTKFIETKGYTITSVTGVSSISFNPSINWTLPATTITTITVFAGNNLTDTIQTSVTVAVRPEVDTESPQVVQNTSIIDFFKQTYPTSVPSGTVVTAIQNSFFVTDDNDFTFVISPTPTNITVLGTYTFNVKVVDEFLNESPVFTIQVRYVDNTDLTPPTITGPATLTFVAGQNKTQVDVIAQYTLADNLDPNPQWFSLTPTTFNTIGTFNYLLRAIDVSGNVAQRTIVVNVVAQTSENDVIPPSVNGPISFRFREADEITLADLIPYYTVVDNVSLRADIEYIATLGGSTLLSTYQFPLGITNIVLRFYDEAENYSLPLNVKVEIIDDDAVIDFEDNATLLNNLTANHQYSGPIVSIIDNGEWKPISWLVDPIQVNYTIDGLNDEININFISKNLDNALPSGELVRVVYDSQSTNRLTWGLPEYDSQERPTNHDVMIVESGSLVKNGNQDFYRHNYKLVELIEILKDYRVPTLTFTSYTSSTIIDSATGNSATYYARPYNALSILQRAIAQAFPITSVESNDLVNLISIVSGTTLQNEMQGVDHQFEEATLYDVIAEIGRIIGKTPVLYLNPNYGSENAKYLLFFEKDNEHSVGIVPKTTLLAQSTEFIETTLPNKGKGQVVVDANNVIGSKATNYPSDFMYGYSTAIDVETPIIGNAKPMGIILPNKISTGEKVRYKQVTLYVEPITNEVSLDNTVIGASVDLPLMKYNEWLVLDADDRDKTAYYKENDNIVYLPNTDDFNSSSISYDTQTIDLITYDKYIYKIYQVEYFPIMDFEVRVGDGNQTTFNQLNSMVDSETLGTQVYNYKNGNEGSDLTISKVAYSYNQILKPTQLVDYDGVQYVITSVSFNSGKTKNGTPRVMYKVAYQLNKKVRRNANLNAPANQREYQIPYDNVFDRFNVIKEKVKLHFTTDVKLSTDSRINEFKYLRDIGSFDYKYLLGGFESASPSPYPTIQTVAFKSTSFVATNSIFTTGIGVNKYILTPVNKTIFGNSLLINIQMFNNVYAGTKIEITGNTSGERFQQRQVSYVDPFGRVKTISLKFSQDALTSATGVYDAQFLFPEYNDEKYNELTTHFAEIPNWQIDKDGRETLNITYQIDFEGVNGTQIAPELLKGCSLYQQRTWSSIPYSFVKLKSANYKASDVITTNDTVGGVIPITEISAQHSLGVKFILDDDYSLDTISTYALLELVATNTYKVIAIMGERDELVITDRVFIYY
jgi:hypothetical protein